MTVSCNALYCSLICMNSRNVVISKQYLPLPLVYAFFSASLPAIASGEKPSAKCRFFDMAFFQRTSTDTITVKISFKQNQLLPLTKSIQNTQARYKKYQSNKTNRFPARDCSTISEQSIKQQASIKQNQSFPWMKLLHDLRGINKKTSNLPRICTKCRI